MHSTSQSYQHIKTPTTPRALKLGSKMAPPILQVLWGRSTQCSLARVRRDQGEEEHGQATLRFKEERQARLRRKEQGQPRLKEKGQARVRREDQGQVRVRRNDQGKARVQCKEQRQAGVLREEQGQARLLRKEQRQARGRTPRPSKRLAAKEKYAVAKETAELNGQGCAK
jgi:hypothetical protein